MGSHIHSLQGDPIPPDRATRIACPQSRVTPPPIPYTWSRTSTVSTVIPSLTRHLGSRHPCLQEEPPPQTLQTCMHTPHAHTHMPTRGISRALQLVMIGFGAKPHTQHRRQGPSRCSPPLMMVFTGLFFFNFVGGLEMKSLCDTSKRSSRAPTCTCFKTAAGAL